MSRLPARAALMLGLALLGQAVVSRAQTSQAQTGPGPTSRASTMPPPPPVSPEQVLAAFAPGPGRELTATACGACHAPTLITGKKLDSEAWAQLVDQMISRGAPVEDQDYDTIVGYLSRHYGPGKG